MFRPHLRGEDLRLRLEPLGLGARRELVLRHRERRQRRVRVLQRPGRDPGVDGGLELLAEALEVEVRQLRLLLGVGVDPLREGRHVDLRLGVRESRRLGRLDPQRVRARRRPSPARRSIGSTGSRSRPSRRSRARAARSPRARPGRDAVRRPSRRHRLPERVARELHLGADRAERLVDHPQRALHRDRLAARRRRRGTARRAPYSRSSSAAITETTDPISMPWTTARSPRSAKKSMKTKITAGDEEQHDPERGRDHADGAVDAIPPRLLARRGLVEPLVVGGLLGRGLRLHRLQRPEHRARPTG